MDCKDCANYMVTKEQFLFVLCQLFKVLVEGWESSGMSYREVSEIDITEDVCQIINALGLGVPEDIMEEYVMLDKENENV